MKARRIATVTWISHRNFGTYLQAYALQHVLKHAGYFTRVIDDASVLSAMTEKKFSPVRFLRKAFSGLTYFGRNQVSVIEEYKRFKHECIDIDSAWTQKEDLSDRYDLFIAGSDQIWSPNVPFDDYYYLGFAAGRKIAYAPSFGSPVIPEAHIERIRPLLEHFESIAVREPSAAESLRDNMGFDVPVVSDPVLLLDALTWDSLLDSAAVRRKSEDSYALCYLLTYNPEYINYVKSYCRQRGLKLKVVAVNKKMIGIGEDLFVGPLTFIDAIRNAEIVFTDSYHGSIFSILYEKEFLAFKRFRSSSPVDQNSRVEHLMDRLGLTSRLLDEDMLHDSWESESIDYEVVSGEVKRFREASLAVLRNMIEQDDEGDL